VGVGQVLISRFRRVVMSYVYDIGTENSQQQLGRLRHP